MYPVIRMIKEIAIHRNAPKLELFDAHHSRHICWPWDLDLWAELNNGRTLTLYDLGRMVLLYRTGIAAMSRQHKWVGTVAGSSVRYRRRVRIFDRIEMVSRILGWDDRFMYFDHTMWVRGTCTSQAMLRVAVVDASGMVPMDIAARAMGYDQSPDLPEWVNAWIAAEATRPWPPIAGPNRLSETAKIGKSD